MIIITSPNGATYQVDEKQLGSTDVFTSYECTLPDGTPAILKIASTVENNGLLDREAYVLETLKEAAEQLEEEYASGVGAGKPSLNNHFFFPNLIETFIASDQDDRRVSVLKFPIATEKLSELVPLSYLVYDNLCVDPRTSAWILGKLLKLLVFTHQQGVYLGAITMENILIKKKEHLVCFYDWTEAVVTDNEVPQTRASREIASITNQVLIILGASTDGSLPADKQIPDSRYEDFLKHLSLGKESDAYTAHKKFYELIRSLWPREYHEFTTKVL